MPKLTATPEMKQAAIADEPKQHESPYGYRYVERTYYPYMNCVVQDGILKAAFYLPEHLRLDGNNPAYEVFLDKKAHQFLTYDHLEKKWRDAKLDRLNWPGRNYYATCWASEKDAAVVQDYFCGERGGDLGILDFQRNVRDEQLEQRHKRITGAWDQDLAQVPELPKDWIRWIDKVAVRENFIFYRYKRGGAQNGYCTFCGKEVPISGHPYHNRNESEKSCEALRRIVQAELMGQFYKLKYFAGDLKQEIHYPIQEAREDVWKQNLSLTRPGLMAKEVDDFYHTIRMGELPHFTCLSCYQGSQRDCLLAAFDSNKKIILVYKDESVVARACLRLTKGSFQQPSTLNFEFADLSKEDVPTGSHAYSEKLVLFLEHIYTSGLKKSEETAAKEMVVALATQKAEELDAVAVLSNQYRGCYPSGRYVSAPIYIYISKSKNGRQYLDSLGGAAVTLAEEQYKQESFLVERAALDRAHAA